MLSGVGGDEVFAGYPRQLAMRIAGALDPIPNLLRRPIMRMVAETLPGGRPGRLTAPLRNAKKFARSASLNFEDRYLGFGTYFTGEMKANLYTEDARVATEEVFGPALPVFRVKSLDEAIEKANNSIFGLGSSIWTNDLNRATRAAERIDAGYTWINSAQVIYDELPFGGLKQSGLGKEHGTEALDYYTETKSVVVATK